MSLHINTELNVCNNCDICFIAYEAGMPCPNCSHPEESQGQNYKFLEQLATSLHINLITHKSFLPSAWFVGCHMDQIQSHFFKLFDERKHGTSSEYIKMLESIVALGDKTGISQDLFQEADIFSRVTKKYAEMYSTKEMYPNLIRRFFLNIKQRI